MEYRGYTIKITEVFGGYGFVADDGSGDCSFEKPNRHGESLPYQTSKIAEKAAKQAIDRFISGYHYEGE